MPSIKEKLPKLSFDQRRGLLTDLEDSSSPLQAFSFLELCNSHEKFFGKPATPLRRAFQKKFDYLKRLSDSTYKSVLSRHSVEPNRFRPVTMSSTPTKTTENDSMFSDDSSSEDGTVEEATNMFSSGLKFGTPAATKPPPVASRPSPASSKIKTPKSSHPCTPPRTPHVGRQLFVGDFGFGDGTRERPWIVPVNPECPERNVAGFFVQPVEKMTHDRYERNG
jgi:hypothetical protein